jgi:hypothetical protein
MIYSEAMELQARENFQSVFNRFPVVHLKSFDIIGESKEILATFAIKMKRFQIDL